MDCLVARVCSLAIYGGCRDSVKDQEEDLTVASNLVSAVISGYLVALSDSGRVNMQ